MSRFTFRAACAALILSSAAAFADDATQLDPLVVTATRTEVRDPAATTTVVSREQIAQSQATDLPDLLRLVGGVEIVRNGGPGQPASVFVRGVANNNHTLVLIDGVPLNTASFTGPAINQIDPNIIERIEIVKGPRSTLYGADALGGVINIITRRGQSAPTAHVEFGAGELNTREIGVSAETRGLRVSLQHLESDGYPGNDAAPEDDLAHENTTVQLAGTRTVGAVTVRADGWASNGTAEAIVGGPAETDFRNELATVGASLAPIAAWRTALNVSRTRDRIDSRTPFGDSFTQSLRTHIDWQNDIAVAERHLLTTGLTAERETVQSTFLPADDAREVDGIFVQHQWQGNLLSATAAVRFTDHSRFGDETTWNLDVGVQPWSGGRLTASAGTGFAAPTAFDLFGFGGNINLDPETSESFELGLRQRLPMGVELRVSAYHTDLDNLITPDGPNFSLVQIDATRIRGVELGLSWAQGPWSASLDGSVKSSEDQATGLQSRRVARRNASASLTRIIGPVTAGLAVQAASDRRDLPNNLPGYALAHATLSWRVMPDLEVLARLENLTDTEYALADGFPAPPRTASARLRYVWGAPQR